MGKNGIESYVHIIMIVFAAVIGACLITVTLQHNIAQRVHADIIKDIEASDFSQTVIDQILYDTNNANGEVQKAFPGCKVEIKSVKDSGINDAANTVIEEVAEVKFTYYCNIFIFLNPIQYELIGYAR